MNEHCYDETSFYPYFIPVFQPAKLYPYGAALEGANNKHRQKITA